MATAKVSNSRVATPATNAKAAAKAAADQREAADKVKLEKFNLDRAKHFVTIGEGEWAEFSAQVRYGESVIVQLMTAKGITLPKGVTLALMIESGQYARCYGRNTHARRTDNGETVILITMHLSSFSQPFDFFVIDAAHALAHALVFIDSLGGDKPEYGMSAGDVHNAKHFATKFSIFGGTTPADRDNASKQNLPHELNADTKKIVDRMSVDHASVILTGEATPKPKRESAKVSRLACPTDAAHFATSYSARSYKGKRPIIDLKCGKCDTKITAAGYVAHSDNN